MEQRQPLVLVRATKNALIQRTTKTSRINYNLMHTYV